MSAPEPSYPLTTSSGYLNAAEAQESDLKSSLMKMTEALQEETSKSLKEIRKTQSSR